MKKVRAAYQSTTFLVSGGTSTTEADPMFSGRWGAKVESPKPSGEK